MKHWWNYNWQETQLPEKQKLDRLGRKPEPVSKKQIVLYHNQNQFQK